MRKVVLANVLIGLSAAVDAQNPADLTTEQVAIIYDQCLARAFAGTVRTDVSAEGIYEVAKGACRETRTMLVAGHDPNSDRALVLDEIDRERAATFPERMRRFREICWSPSPKPRLSPVLKIETLHAATGGDEHNYAQRG